MKTFRCGHLRTDENTRWNRDPRKRNGEAIYPACRTCSIARNRVYFDEVRRTTVDDLAVELVVLDGHSMKLNQKEKRAAIELMLNRKDRPSRKQIADRVGCSLRTIERHVKQSA